MAELTIIYWRDIPAQVTAKAKEATARARLSDRFENAIDAAAMKAGLIGADEYLEEWRQETRPCGDALEEEVAAEAARLEARYPPEVLRLLASTGGLQNPPDPADNEG